MKKPRTPGVVQAAACSPQGIRGLLEHSCVISAAQQGGQGLVERAGPKGPAEQGRQQLRISAEFTEPRNGNTCSSPRGSPAKFKILSVG